ncbi:MAG TPA: hypothetical protein VK778_16415 [Solirubrobacteraceae bacterium]|jgi:hypothetical protein|nr:hypothetical protein [Solirubrobacteraceae bacterium]
MFPKREHKPPPQPPRENRPGAALRHQPTPTHEFEREIAGEHCGRFGRHFWQKWPDGSTLCLNCGKWKKREEN